MSASQSPRAGIVPAGAPPAAVLEALAGAINAEVRLLEDLIGIMRGQRAAVAADDLQGVDDSVFAVHRVLVTVGEARRHRRALNELLGVPADLPLRDLEDALGDHMGEALRFARDGLRAAALTLSQEVELNRQVLRGALSSGTSVVRSLYGAAEAPRSYGVNLRPSEAETPGGVLINRRA